MKQIKTMTKEELLMGSVDLISKTYIELGQNNVDEDTIMILSQSLAEDLSKTYKGIAISSGNSFVHETESQVILNGSYNINFTMDLVLKDTSLFDNLAKKLNAPLEISPQIVEIFKDGQKKYGSRAWSSMIVKRMEDLNNINFRANGFPDELVDNEPEEKGYEI